MLILQIAAGIVVAILLLQLLPLILAAGFIGMLVAAAFGVVILLFLIGLENIVIFAALIFGVILCVPFFALLLGVTGLLVEWAPFLNRLSKTRDKRLSDYPGGLMESWWGYLSDKARAGGWVWALILASLLLSQLIMGDPAIGIIFAVCFVFISAYGYFSSKIKQGSKIVENDPWLIQVAKQKAEMEETLTIARAACENFAEVKRKIESKGSARSGVDL